MAHIWEQIGIDLFGNSPGDSFGFTGISLSKDGSIMAVGAQFNDDNGTDSGHVRIFENINNTWTQIGSDIVGEYAYDQCGVSVDLSDDGKIVAIGSWHNDGTSSSVPGYERDNYPNGQVRVYKYINNDWTQIGLDIDGFITDEWSGHSVSLSSDGTFVGIGGQNSNKNSVYEYKNNSWSIVNSFPAKSGSSGATSLSSDGTTFAIADDNGGLDGRGLIKIFKNNNGSWLQLGNDIESLTFNERLLGHAIHLSENGSFLAISAPYSDQDKGGLVRVYEFLNNQWIQIGPDIKQSNIATEFGMGLSITADGSLLAIGAPSESQVYDGDSVVWGGSVRLYQNINNEYVQLGSDIYGDSTITNIGYRIDLSSDGSTLAIGSRSNGVRVYSIDHNPPTISGPGGETSIRENNTAIYTFSADETVTWSITGGVDKDLFTIDSNTGLLSFKTAPDYEIPTDSDLNNTYQVVVKATDSASLFSTQELYVHVNNVSGSVITVNQDQYDMLRGKVSSFQDIHISSGKETTEEDVYIVPFIANNYYWFGSDKTGNGLKWSFDLGNIDSGDRILIDYPIGDFDTNELDQLWDISKIFEAAHCIWIDGYYIGEPLFNNVYEFETLFSNGFTSFGNHPESIELAFSSTGSFDSFQPSQFGLIDLSGSNLDEVIHFSADFLLKVLSERITPRDKVLESPLISGLSGNAGNSIENISIDENIKAVYNFESDQPVIWSLSGGTDISKFTINSSSGELNFIEAPDYEMPTDSDLNNIYQVVVKATDSARNISTQELTININNISETTGEEPLSDLEALQYVASNPDLITAFGIDTAAASSHYTNYGISEGRNLTLFSASLYLAKYSDLSAAFGNDETLALKHYIQNGYAEGRTDSSSLTNSGSSSGSSSVSDSSSTSDSGSSSTTSSIESLSNLEALQYIASNPDLIAAFGINTASAISHYENYGISEGRSLTAFSASVYLATYSDLSSAFGDDQTSALKHYIQYGYAEGRTDSSSGSGSSGSSNLTDFQALNYIASYGDLINAFGTDITSAKSHYTNNGKVEGRVLDDFDEWGYLASNNDLMKAFGSDTTQAVKHYIYYGNSEGRSTDIFNATSYLNNYGDLRNAFGNDQELATKHYVEYGFNEGRVF